MTLLVTYVALPLAFGALAIAIALNVAVVLRYRRALTAEPKEHR
jgi:hypothetical protein